MTLLGGWLVDVIPPLEIAVAMSVAQLVMYVTIGHIDTPLFAVVTIAGSYQVALWISMVVPALGLVLAMATRRSR